MRPINWFPVCPAVVCIVLSSCAGLSGTGRQVQVATAQPQNSKFLGRVESVSPLSGVFQQASYENAVRGALNKASEMGATHLVIDADCSSRFWGFRQDVRGNAYQQKSAPGASTHP